MRLKFSRQRVAVQHSKKYSTRDYLWILDLNEKPNLENLSLFVPDLQFSTIYHFINGNHYLKQLSLDEQMLKNNENETVDKKLVELLSCDHGIQELQFVRHGWLKSRSSTYSKWKDRIIRRDEFPELIAFIKNRISTNSGK